VAKVYVATPDTTPPVERGHPPRSQLIGAERGNPNEVWEERGTVYRPTSKRTVRDAQLLSGNGMVQEANASSRKERGIHNPLDRVIPNPKGC